MGTKLVQRKPGINTYQMQQHPIHKVILGMKLLYIFMLARQFFQQDAVTLAQKLLGKVIVRKTNQGIIKQKIVQTEAYKAPEDKASHAYNSTPFLTDKKTERTKYFWLDGGHLYLFTIYTPNNLCVNIVVGNKDQPQAVLIRATEIVQGMQIVQKFRKNIKGINLTNGPGKVGKSLGLQKSQHNGYDLCLGDQIYLQDGESEIAQIGSSKRINIDYAEDWKDKQWRFYLKGNKYISKVVKKKKQLQEPKLHKRIKKQ